ncbi:hypothetical protein [Paenibacillus sp. FSL R7-269]|uniref:hypothetical protein n=1 Tax=Paenibacillus sp. FSL R7-269 TaxID=1226755 RepID=UPI0004AFDF5B|nr:hypothetical protein [Paenibacillus sp. FSL R7-269]
MKFTCDKCGEVFAYEDEVSRYDINGNPSGDIEQNAQNPDNWVTTLCGECDA